MPWIPELFSASALERLEAERRRDGEMPLRWFDGLMTGEVGPLVRSFAGEPEVHHPIRGRVKGAAAFARFAAETRVAMAAATFEDGLAMIAGSRGMEEIGVHMDGPAGNGMLPMALVAERTREGHLVEVRLYFARPAGAGGRPPLLAPDPDLRAPDVVADHQRALAAGDVEAAVATFVPDGVVQDAAGAAHRGPEALSAVHERLLGTREAGSVGLCAVTDDGRTCGLEYNVVPPGDEAAPTACMAVYVRGEGGKLAAVRLYGDEPM